MAQAKFGSRTIYGAPFIGTVEQAEAKVAGWYTNKPTKDGCPRYRVEAGAPADFTDPALAGIPIQTIWCRQEVEGHNVVNNFWHTLRNLHRAAYDAINDDAEIVVRTNG